MPRTQLTSAYARFDAAEAWRVNLGAAFSDLIPEPLEEHPAPRGAMRGLGLGQAATFMVSGTPQVVRRTTTAVRRAPGDLVKVCVQLRGQATVRQDDRELVLDPGRLGVYDTGRPYALRLDGTWMCAVMAVPRPSLGISEAALAAAMRRTFSAEHGPGLVLSDFVAAAVQQIGQTSPATAMRLGEAGTSLLAGTLVDDGELAACEAADDLRAHVTAYIRAHLNEPQLCRASVSAAHHMSARTLDRLFAGEPLTVSGLIRHERLEAVRRDLENPHLRQRSVSALAARWCFFDAAHFSRLFRQHYGCPPSQMRPG